MKIFLFILQITSFGVFSKEVVYTMPYFQKTEDSGKCPVSAKFICANRPGCVQKCKGNVCKYKDRIKELVFGKNHANLNVIFLYSKDTVVNGRSAKTRYRIFDKLYGNQIDTVSGSFITRQGEGVVHKFKSAPVIEVKAISYREDEKCK